MVKNLNKTLLLSEEMSLWCLKNFLFFFFFLFLLNSRILASETYFSSYLKLKNGYDDNIAFTYYRPEEDFFTIISPFLYLNYKSERASCYSKIGLDVYRYGEYTRLNTTNQHYEIKGDYLLKEKWQIYGHVYFIKDTTLQSELRETGIVHVREDRKRYTISLGTTYFLNELNQLTFDITGSRTKYDWKYYVDYDLFSISTTFQHQMKTQKDMLMSKIYYTNIDSDTSKVNNVGFLIGWQHLLSENTNFTTFLGARYTIMDYYLYYQRIIINPFIWPPFEVIIEKRKETDREWNYLIDLSFQKKGERISYSLNGNYDLVYSSFGEPVNRARISGQIFYKWSPHWILSLFLSYYITSSKGRIYEEDNRFFHFRSNLKYFLKDRWFLEFSYSYSNFDDRVRDYNRDRNQFLVILTFQLGKPSAARYKTF